MERPAMEFSDEITIAWRIGVRGTAQKATITNMMTEYNFVNPQILSKILVKTEIAFHHV